MMMKEATQLLSSHTHHNNNKDEGAAARSRCNPLAWSELQSIIGANELHKLARSEEQKLTYQKARSKIESEWESIYDYILCTKFNFPINNDEVHNSEKKRSKPTLEEWRSMLKKSGNDRADDDNTRIVLSLNDFPYYFDQGIEHWLVWKLGGEINIDEIDSGKMDILKQACCPNMELIHDKSVFLHFLNPPNLKSLPDVDHVHILFRRSAIL